MSGRPRAGAVPGRACRCPAAPSGAWPRRRARRPRPRRAPDRTASRDRSACSSTRSTPRTTFRRTRRLVCARAPASWRTSTIRSWACSVSRRAALSAWATSSWRPSSVALIRFAWADSRSAAIAERRRHAEDRERDERERDGHGRADPRRAGRRPGAERACAFPRCPPREGGRPRRSSAGGDAPTEKQRHRWCAATPSLRLTPFRDRTSFGHASSFSRARRSSAARIDPTRRQQERRPADPRQHRPRRRPDGARQHPAHPGRRDHARAAGRSRRVGRVDWVPTSSGWTRGRFAPSRSIPKLCARIRASILLAGPMLARFGKVTLPPPGGDVIGRRRVDTHFLALEQLGASVTVGRSLRARGQEGPDRRRHLPRRAERHRDRERAHGGRRRQGPHGAPERRLRAARPGSRPGAGGDGRPDRRHRVQHLHRRRRTPTRRRRLRHRPRSHRDRQLHRARRGDQRRDHHRSGAVRRSAEHAARTSSGSASGRGSTDSGSPSTPTRSAASGPISAATCPSSRTDRGRRFPPTSCRPPSSARRSAPACCWSSRRCSSRGSFFVDKLIGMGARIVLCDPHRAVISGSVAAQGRHRRVARHPRGHGDAARRPRGRRARAPSTTWARSSAATSGSTSVCARSAPTSSARMTEGAA